MRNRLQWLNMSELERQKAHSNLRSPEVIAFALMTNGELKDSDKDSVQINYFSYLNGVDIYSSKVDVKGLITEILCCVQCSW